MASKEFPVTLTNATVVKESFINKLTTQQRGGGFWPNDAMSYTIDIAGKNCKIMGVNQRVSPEQKITIMQNAKGKAEWMYDAFLHTQPPLVLSNPRLQPFLEHFSTLDIPTTLYKKKAFSGGKQKKIKKQMEQGSFGNRATALVLRRKIGVQSQVLSTQRITLILLLLVKDSQGFFITETKLTLKYTNLDRHNAETIKFNNHGGATTVGQLLEVIYDPDDKSCLILDKNFLDNWLY